MLFFMRTSKSESVSKAMYVYEYKSHAKNAMRNAICACESRGIFVSREQSAADATNAPRTAVCACVDLAFLSQPEPDHEKYLTPTDRPFHVCSRQPRSSSVRAYTTNVTALTKKARTIVTPTPVKNAGMPPVVYVWPTQSQTLPYVTRQKSACILLLTTSKGRTGSQDNTPAKPPATKLATTPWASVSCRSIIWR